MGTGTDTAALIIDVQGKLAELMHDRDALFDGLTRFIRGVRILDLPILWTEQYPEGLGRTTPEIAELLRPLEPIAKRSFSCMGDDGFRAALTALGPRRLLLAGIETHICVYQTARDLAAEGYAGDLVADAVSSRTQQNRAIGLERMRLAGVKVTSVESALFELLGTARDPRFREILKVVK